MNNNNRTGGQRFNFTYTLAVVFCVLLAAGLVTSVLSVPFPAPTADTPPRRLAEIGGGEYSARIDQAMELEHPFRDPALNLVSFIRLALFREGTGPVVVDREYRLFTREEFEQHPGDTARLTERIAWILGVLERLEREGSRTVVVLVPSKARISGAALPERWRKLGESPRLNRTRAGLAEAGYVVVDATEGLRQTAEPFLNSDTHWSPAGTRAVARLIADRVANEFEPTFLPEAEVVIEYESALVHRGDLMQFVPLGRFEPLSPLAPDRLEPFSTTVSVNTGGAGLFDTPEIPVTLVGTSYSAGRLWNFEGALQHALQADVLNVADEGQGPFVPMVDYLLSDTYREISPKLVIWEIPERYLTLPGTVVPEL